jgi:hypothetical protein
MSGTNVLSDAQMGMFQVIRPMPNFEQVYQGASGTIPIAFPGVLDAQAGKPGMSPNLLAGIPVPLGGRLLLQIPMTIAVTESIDIIDNYAYQLVWRTRNQSSVAESILQGRPASAFHLPSQRPGRDQVSFIPGCSDVEVFEQGEDGGNPAYLNVVQQRYRPRILTPWVQPLTQSGTGGVWQQGVYNADEDAPLVGPSWAPLWLDVQGDELLILAYKVETAEPWDFTDPDEDLAFSNTFGNNNGSLTQGTPIGLLLSQGTQGS